ncbi:MAG: hypothetical protein ACHQM6_10555 [Candidatus Kapaibacterium sp.]
MRILVFFSILLFAISIAFAQEQNSTKANGIGDPVSGSRFWWLTLGYGASTVSDAEIGLGVGAIITAEYGHHFFSARIIHDQGAREDVYPKQLIFDTGLLYGIGTHNTLWFGSAAVGVAYTATTKSVFDHLDSSFTHAGNPVDVDRPELFRGIGFAWQLQLFSRFSDSSPVGMGVTICGNINRSFPFYLLMISFEFGKFRVPG